MLIDSLLARIFHRLTRLTAASLTAAAFSCCAAQQAQLPSKPKPNPAEKNPAQIELLETRVRFETNGDSRKEVHTSVKINNELGARQFARLNFDFNRSFQSVEIPFVRITHTSGGVADILPSAITDNPNPAVVDFPAYHDVRVKSVRILGLQPGDLLEYRVITTTTHHPLAPDFWLEHTFDRSGVVSKEIFEIDVPNALVPPADRPQQNSLPTVTLRGAPDRVPHLVQMRINPETPATSESISGEGDGKRKTFRWEVHLTNQTGVSSETSSVPSDVSITTFTSWRVLAERLAALDQDSPAGNDTVETKAAELTAQMGAPEQKMRALYEYVSKSIQTVDLPLSASGFRAANPAQILLSGYGVPLDKLHLLDRLSRTTIGQLFPAFVGDRTPLSEQLPMPSLVVAAVGSVFVHDAPMKRSDGTTSVCDHCGEVYWLDPALDVAPFGMLRADERGKTALFLGQLFPMEGITREGCWQRIPNSPPFASAQKVSVNASVARDGTLAAKVRYALRGDNELLLRVAFHKTAKEKWKDVAQMLALSDGFRGEIKNVTASDPYATKDPFSVEYEIEQPKFVDWSKKVVRTPALLPSPGLPDVTSSGKYAATGSSANKNIDLGTPLEIELDTTMNLPEGTSAQAPPGTSVERDYATFSSNYSAQGNTLHAARKLHFIAEEIPASRAGDLNAFLHAVQADQSQLFTLQPAAPK